MPSRSTSAQGSPRGISEPAANGRSGAAGHRVVGYPALLDNDESVSLRIVTNRDLQLRVMRGGVRRLLLLTAAPSLADAARRSTRAPGWRSPPAGLPRRPRRRLPVRRRRRSARRRSAALGRGRSRRCRARCAHVWSIAAATLAGSRRCSRAPPRRAPAARPPRVRAVIFGRRTPRRTSPASQDALRDRRRASRIDDVRRYVEGIGYRLDRLAEDVGRDVRRMARSCRWNAASTPTHPARAVTPGHDTVAVRWLLEELRMSVFAQPLGVAERASTRRVGERLIALGA